ncbi:MAG: metal ABC transporter ATP-binding protein [Candidatus Azotimanducaceae bacterium]|uniref:ABC transporter ATP-binding protein n=1 Tax=OM182 bacterium TaxID=2510334 RepID=A0A520S1W7_9GAMM|nr:ABC transporter [Gammaproteobacteria bacterium]OUV67040.1 MAG: ABC transporter [Gammaproteobacteria bacterium TMED133]RZO76473.1 MAG: ABC transporter ATP-binding protein [OM182 bacterium]
MNIYINDLTVTYDNHPAIHHLTATIAQGEWLGIVGPNGAGKSTLLKAMAGQIEGYEGCIDGLTPESVAYLPQQTQLDTSFPITVFDLVTIGFWQQQGFSTPLSDRQYRQSHNALKVVGLGGFEERLIGTLSGGQLQRSLFARVLLQDQPIILLDEPFNAIDTKTLADLTQVVKQWHQNKRTIIMVTHDLDYVREHCPNVLLLARECVGHGAASDVLSEDNLIRARQVSEAFDGHAAWCPG